MAKNWQIPVCTRYRLMVTSILVLFVCALAALSIGTIGHAINRRQVEHWQAKAAQIEPGLTRSELVRILGKPQLKERIASTQGLWQRGMSPQEEKDLKARQEGIVAYYYDKAFFLNEHALRYVVYLDGNEEKTLFKPRVESVFFHGPGRSGFIFIFSLAGLAGLVWFFIRSWCRKKLRESQVSRPGDEIRK